MENIHVITGGSSGIGLECAKRFKEGTVLITGRGEEKLKKAEEILKKEGIKVTSKISDISNRESIKELFNYAKSLGKVKTILNSAGVSGDMADAKRTFEIDLLGTENIINEALKVVEEDSVVILIASMMGHVIPANLEYDKFLESPSQAGAIDSLIEIVEDKSDVAYNFSKRGVQLMVRKYAFKFGNKKARIVSVSPGIIMTPMAEKAAAEHPEQMEYMKSMTPAGRNGKAEDIANAICFLADDKSSFITGIDLLVDGGLTIKLPRIVAAHAGQ